MGPRPAITFRDELCETHGDCCDDCQEVCVAEPCDPTLICGRAMTCVGAQWYRTTCGPANCDEPLGPRDSGPSGCGGPAGLTCEDREFCSYAEEDQCGAADPMGVCKPIPQLCGEIWSPVCGCDGNNYVNPCKANGAGTSVKHESDCGCEPGQVQQYCWGSLQCIPMGATC